MRPPEGLREERNDEEPSHERWLVSYADFITLMFAFFAVLYATSQKDVEKSQQFQESIKKFLIKAGSFGGGPSPQVNQADKGDTAIDSPIQTFRPTKSEPATDTDEAETFFESQLSAEERKRYVSDIVTDDWGVRIILVGEALFAPGSEKFREEAMPFVAKLSELLAQTKRKVLIEGHVGAGEKGRYHSTWEFSSARSLNVLRFVQAKKALPPERLASAALGDSRPQTKGRAGINSRIEVVVLNSETDF